VTANRADRPDFFEILLTDPNNRFAMVLPALPVCAHLSHQAIASVQVPFSRFTSRHLDRI
jgi:hypothetical protein